MEYGRDDQRGWTVKREEPEDGPLAWVFAHGVLLIGGVVLGVVAGYLWPLILMSLPGRSAHSREMNREVSGRTATERRYAGRQYEGEDALREAAREKGTDMAIHGTEDDARGRALIGGVLGALAAVGVALASRKKS